MTAKAQLVLSFAASAALIATAAIAAPAAQDGITYTVALTGAAEVPGPGDPDGTGTATLTVNPSQQRVCYTLSATNIATPTASHIHIGPAGVAGPVVVPLATPTGTVTFTSAGCINNGRLAAQLWARPENYYVNVHNSAFPAGAVRGQLPPKKP